MIQVIQRISKVFGMVNSFWHRKLVLLTHTCDHVNTRCSQIMVQDKNNHRIAWVGNVGSSGRPNAVQVDKIQMYSKTLHNKLNKQPIWSSAHIGDCSHVLCSSKAHLLQPLIQSTAHFNRAYTKNLFDVQMLLYFTNTQ